MICLVFMMNKKQFGYLNGIRCRALCWLKGIRSFTPESLRHASSILVCTTMSNSLEERVKLLEQEVVSLRRSMKEWKPPKPRCIHEYEKVGGRNNNYRLYFSGAHAYIKCIRCGKRKQA